MSRFAGIPFFGLALMVFAASSVQAQDQYIGYVYPAGGQQGSTFPVKQIGAGEVNEYRFQATQGQRLVIAAKARQLIPYVADGVPGWFQAVLRLHDADGNEVAYNDDFRFDPDPVIYFEVPDDGEYRLTINEALFRGRESFTYRITLGELPYLTSLFPLGGRVGEPIEIEMDGWNLEKTTLSPPSSDANPGHHLIATCRKVPSTAT